GVAVLVRLLQDEDAEVQSAAMNSLEAFGELAVEALGKILCHESALVRACSAEVMIRINSKYIPAVVAVVTEGLRHRDRAVRCQASSAIVAAGPAAKAAGKELIPVLAGCLRDEEDVVRYNAASALSAFGPDAKPAIPVLTEALKDRHEYVRGYAATALGSVGPDAKPAVMALAELVEDEDEY